MRPTNGHTSHESGLPASLRDVLLVALPALSETVARLGKADIALELREHAARWQASRAGDAAQDDAAEAAALSRAAREALETQDTPDAAVLALLDRLDAACGAVLRRDARNHIFGLYVIIDTDALQDRDPLKVTRAALDGGARLIQLRDKTRDKGDSLPLARNMRRVCDQAHALFIVNDHADLAVASGAHGIHVGQHDLPPGEARRVLRPRQLLGTSNATADEGRLSEQIGVDYIAVGSIYPTTSKTNTRPAGVETLRKVRDAVRTPVVAIGGINAGNVAPVVRAGADGICVLSAVTLAWDPEAAARELVAAIRAAGGRA